MTRKAVAVGFILLGVSLRICLAQGNPFVSAAANESSAAADGGYPEVLTRAIGPLIEVQKSLCE